MEWQLVFGVGDPFSFSLFDTMREILNVKVLLHVQLATLQITLIVFLYLFLC